MDILFLSYCVKQGAYYVNTRDTLYIMLSRKHEILKRIF
jgi:hypothetical protein